MTNPSPAWRPDPRTIAVPASSEGEHAHRILVDAIEQSAATAFEVHTHGGLFRQMADTVTEILYVSRPDGEIEYMNRRFTEFTGIPLQEALGFGWAKAVHPDDLGSITTLLKNVLAREEHYEIEYRLRAADGTYRWFLARSQPTFDANGRVERWIGTGTDIQVIKDAQEQVKQGQDRYAAFIHNSSEGIWRYELEQPMPLSLPMDEKIEWSYAYGYLAECNDAMARMYGFTSASDITGARLADLLVRDDPNNVAFLRGFIESGYRIEDAESSEKDKDGNARYFLNTFVGVLKDGHLLRAWGVQRDITRKRAEQMALSESEKRYEHAAKAGLVGVWEWTVGSDDLYLSPDLKEMLGYTDEELPNTLSAWCHIVHPNDVAPTIAATNAHLEGKLPVYETVVRRRHKNGEYLWFLARGTADRDESGKPVRLVGADTNITERKKVEMALLESEERLRIAIDAGEIGAWEWNIAENRVIWSERHYQFHGMKPGTYDGTVETFSNTVHPDDRERVQAAIQKTLEQDAPYKLEFRTQHPDGTVRWLSTNARVLRDPDGRPLRMLGATTDITERVLRDEEVEVFRFISDHANDAHFLIGEDTHFFYVNEIACQTLGYTKEELLALKVRDINPTFESSGFQSLLQRLTKERIKTFESVHRRKDGTEFPIEVSVLGIMYKGKVCNFSIVRDISERKNAEKVLSESEEHLRFALTASKLVAWDWCATDKSVSLSENAEEVLGIASSAGLLGHHTDGFIHVEDRLEHKQIVAAAAQQKGGEYVSQFRFIRPDDRRVIWVEDRARVTVDDAGKITRVGGIIQDITDRKAIEAAVRTLNAELEQNVADRTRDLHATLQRIKQMIAHMPIGAIAIDENLRILEVNEMCCQMLCIPVKPEEMLGKSAWEFAKPFQEMLIDKEAHMQDLRTMMENKMPVFGREIPLRDGRILLRDYIPIFEEGVFHGNLTLYRDITKDRRIDATKSEFMSLASHQLRTPLTAVRWTLSKLERSFGDRATEFERYLLQEGRKASSRMTETIDTMLQISRIESGTVELKSEEMDLLQCMSNVLEGLAQESAQKGQKVSIDCPERLRLQTDSHFLQEILVNLFSNAVKYTPNGGSITIRASEQHGSVRIDVTDTGYGIPTHQQSKIFRKFFRGDNVVSKDTQGTGLGLYLVSLMTGLLDGTISFQSQEGEGTTFSLVLEQRH